MKFTAPPIAPNTRFGSLRVLRFYPYSEGTRARCACVCDCGNRYTYDAYELRAGRRKACSMPHPCPMCGFLSPPRGIRLHMRACR